MESKFTWQKKQVANVGDGKNINRKCILLEQVMSTVNEFDLNSKSAIWENGWNLTLESDYLGHFINSSI